MSDVPVCEECSAEHPWLLSLNSMVKVVNFVCNECDWQQTRVLEDE